MGKKFRPWKLVNRVNIEPELDEVWHLIKYNEQVSQLRISHWPKGKTRMTPVKGKVPGCVDRIKIVTGSFNREDKSYEMIGNGRWIEGAF